MNSSDARHWPISLLWSEVGPSRHRFRDVESALRYAQDKARAASVWDGARLAATYDPFRHGGNPIERYHS